MEDVIVRHLEAAIERLEIARDATQEQHWSPKVNYTAALANVGKGMDSVAEGIAEMAQQAFNVGVTKKKIAELLGVTPATFRGMRKTEVGRDDR